MILVTGGTGVMGSVLVRNLREQGKQVRVLTLPGDPGIERVKSWGVEVRTGSVASAEDVRGLCEGVQTVYHLAAIIIAGNDSLYDSINVGGTENVVNDARRHGVEHFIHVSSASVVYPRPTTYSLSKRRGEALVRDSGLAFTIVRPTLVYDRWGGLEFNLFLEYLRQFPVVPFIGTGQAKKRPVYTDDITDGLLKLADCPAARAKQYNFSGAEPIRIIDFARLCLRMMGMGAKPIVPVPVWLCLALARVMERYMDSPPLRWPVIAGVTQDADLDPSQAIEEIGYDPARVSEKLPECFPRAKR
jgi:NADH dehydrogenase